MQTVKAQGRARGSKAIAPDEVPSSEVRGDLLDNEIQFDVSVKPDPADESRNILAAKSPGERAVIALNSTKTESDLRKMVLESRSIEAVLDKAGRDLAHSTGMTLKNARVTIEKAGKAAREDAQAFSKAVIAEEKRLIALTEAEEARIFKLRDDYDAEQARIKEEAERRARERAAAIRAKIDAIASLPGKLAGASSAQLVEELQKLVAMQPTAEEFDGQLAEVLLTIETVGSALSALLEGARQREEEERKRIAEQEAERARLAAQAEENARIAAEIERKRQEAEAAAKAQAEELARQRQEAEAAARAQAEVIAREREELERQRAELEALRAAMQPKPEPIPEPEVPSQGVRVELIPTKGDHAPQFDWDEPAKQLGVTTVTLAVMPDFAALDESEPDDEAAIEALRAAIWKLRATRSGEFVSAVVLETLEQIERA